MLAPGARIGPFEVLAPLGSGGMGEVYRARDTMLRREVALKTLPDEVAREPERLARLRREARILASLNHPGIATLYGLEESEGGVPVLVMELVPGETLTDRLHRGPLGLKEVLRIGQQIAEALAAAHEKGVLHRDLKPANICLTPEGRVKVLDFGLARALGVDGPEFGSQFSTATSPPSHAGKVLGTAPYMSPEQARGQEVDRRCDVWAFGCVLFELLAGRRAFPGASFSEAAAAILAREPDWGALPEGTPYALQRLLRRCLKKDRDERLHDVADAGLELKELLVELSSGAAAPATPRRRTRWLWGAGLLAAATGGLVAWLALRASPLAPTAPKRLTLAPPARVALMDSAFNSQHLALSPRGDRVAFSGLSDTPRLYVRAIGDIEAQAIPSTEDARDPFFSPDGRWLGFAQNGALRKVLLEGGAPVTIADIPERGSLRGAHWGPDGTIVFSPGPQAGLWRVPADGGTPRQITTPDAAPGEISHRWPQVLPGGSDVLFTVLFASSLASDARIEGVSLETGERRLVVERTGYARYSPSGHVVYASRGTLLAASFDASRLAVTGAAVAVLDDVQMNASGHLYADFEISSSGALVYVPGFPRLLERSLLWVDRQGRSGPVTRTRRPFTTQPRLSPDGRRLAVEVATEGFFGDIWVLDLDRDAWTRLTSDGHNNMPEWHPDGRSLAFSTTGSRWVMRMPADGGGSAEGLSGLPGEVNLDGWSPDGQVLVYSWQGAGTSYDVHIFPIGSGAPRLLLSAPYLECCAALSPDGRWMAYVSNESGRYEIYVQPFPGPGAKRPVSTDGGIQPRWSRDGRELFYRSYGERPKLVVIPVDTRGGFRLGAARPLFDDVFAERTAFHPATYDVFPDGQRFLFVEEPEDAPAPRQLVLIPDWASELKTKLRAARR